jgi:peptidoglycan/xylan/chitin deacetylase (PgdA/CDA1 family)
MTLSGYISTPVSQKRIVIITFDDGYMDNYSVAYPILRKFGFTATFFITPSYVNTDHIYWWDLQGASVSGDQPSYQLLTWQQIREMERAGFEIGSHTCTHAILTKISEVEAWREVDQSRRILSDALGKSIESFCYPEGRLNKTVIEMVKKTGYSCGVVTPSHAGIPLSRYTLRRVGIYYSTDMLRFLIKTFSPVWRYRELFMRLPNRRDGEEYYA